MENTQALREPRTYPPRPHNVPPPPMPEPHGTSSIPPVPGDPPSSHGREQDATGLRGSQSKPEIRENLQRQVQKKVEGKLEYDLLPEKPIEDLVKVFQYGAKKYGKHNWELGFPVSYYACAIKRHLSAYLQGEDTDPETDLSHLMHICANAVMCYGNQIEHGEKFDDRRKGKLR